LLVDKAAKDVLTSEHHQPFSALNAFNPGHLTVALEAQIDVSCAASKTPRSLLLPLLPLSIGKLLLAGSRCGDLAHT
jgi:hypothetical protein